MVRMKKVILSRKGFDSKYGGRPSPIFSDGNIFSLPIPQNSISPNKYRSIEFNKISCEKAFLEASVTQVNLDSYCHFDPDLNQRIGLFGQAGSAQSELKNNKVSIGDLFLFFGWFKNFNFIKKDIHLIFGWLEIDEIISGNLEISKFLKQEKLSHPHDPKFKSYKNNTLYVGRKNFGLFTKFSNQLTLTANGYSRSMWEFPKEYFKNSKDIGSELFANRIQWNHKNNFLVDTNLGPGQEFILNVEKNPQVKKWAKSLIKNNI